MSTRTHVAKKKARKATKVAGKKKEKRSGPARSRGLTGAQVERLRALDASHAERPDFPVSDILGEARALLKIVGANRKRLFQHSELTAAMVADLAERGSILDAAERAWTRVRQRTAAPRLVKARAAAEALERPMIDALKHFLRSDADAVRKVRDIEVGADDEDTIDDLHKLADLWDARAGVLKKADVPPKVAAKARAAAEELAEASDAVETDEAPGAARELRDRAYWHLRSLMDEVREQGRYVFRNEPQKLVHFRASSTRANADAKRRRRTKAEPDAAPA